MSTGTLKNRKQDLMCCLHAVSGPDNFSCEKKKSGFFFGSKKFCRSGRSGFFVKTRGRRKIHDGVKFGELVVQPTVG
jgi:hypothetical protein